MHGGGAKDDRLRIAIELERNAGTLVASIEDNGSAFDPTQVPPPPVPASLDEAKVGDNGIHLMRGFASGIHYERRDGTNRLTMRFAQKHSGSRG
jgi:anti-sigma regulatory factor (Ser/Thr protein kinase)